MSGKSITKNYIYNLIYQVLILVLPIVTTPYISRVLGAENVGIYSYTYSIVSYFILFGGLGVSLYGQREIAYAGEDKQKRKRAFIEIVIFRAITVTIALVVYLIAFVRNSEYSIYYGIWSLELIATALDISWFLQGMEEFKKTVLRNVLVRLVSVTLIFVCVKTKEDLIKYITIYSLADLIGNLSLWIYLPKYLKGVRIKKISVFQHIAPIMLLFVPQIASQIYNMLDRTMIGKMIADKSEVGYYEEGQKVIRVLVTIATSLGTVMVPRMASTFASGDKEKVREYLKKSFQFAFLLSVPMMFGLISISEAFVPIFFGAGYEKTAILMNVISPTIILFAVASVIGYQYLLPTKKQKEYTLAIGIGLVVNFILNYILIIFYNSIGASISTVISELIVVLIELYIIRNEVSIKELAKLSYKYFIAGGIMLIVCLLVKLIAGLSLGAMIGQIIVGAVTYIGILAIMKDEHLFMLLNRVKLMVRRK